MNTNRKRLVPGTAVRVTETMAEPQERFQGDPHAEVFELLPIQPRSLRNSDPHLGGRSSGHQSIGELNQYEPVLPRLPSFVTRPPVRTNGLRKTTQPRFYTHRPYRARLLPNIPRSACRNGGRGVTSRPRLQPQYVSDHSELLPSSGSPVQQRQSRPQGNRVGPPVYRSPRQSPSQFRRPRELTKVLPAPPAFETKPQLTPQMRDGQQKLRQPRPLVPNFPETSPARPIVGERTKLLPPPPVGKQKSVKIKYPYLEEPKTKPAKPAPKLLEKPISLWSINNIEYITYGERIGSGAFSNVFIIRRKSDEQRLAAKCSRMTAKSRVYIRREFVILSRLNHPNIIKALDFIEFRNVSMIVMEYFTGGNIIPNTDDGTKIPENVARIYARQCFQVLAYIHSCGVLHNDIKPENILLNFEEFCPHGRTIECDRLKCVESLYNIKLIDFGLAAVLPPGQDVIKGSAGTILYMSPETKHCYRMSPKSDVWSMGMTTYQLLAGRLPYEKTSRLPPITQMLAHRSACLNVPELYALSDSGRHFLRHTLEIDFEKRYSAAEALDHPWLNPRTPVPVMQSFLKILLQKAAWVCRLCNGVCRCCTRKISEIRERIQIRCRNIARQQILDRRAAEEILGMKNPIPRTVVEKYIPYHDRKPGYKPQMPHTDSRCSNSPNLELAAEYLERRGIKLDETQDHALPGPSHKPTLWVKVGDTGFKPVTGPSTTVQMVRSKKIGEQEYSWSVDHTEYEPQSSTSVESWKYINGNNFEPIAGPSNAPQTWRRTQYTQHIPQLSMPATPRANGGFQCLLEDFEKACSDFETMSSSEFHEWLNTMHEAKISLPKWMKIDDGAIDIFKPFGRLRQSNTIQKEPGSSKRVQHTQIKHTVSPPIQRDTEKRPDIRMRPRDPNIIPTQTPIHSLRRRMLPVVPGESLSRRESWQTETMDHTIQDVRLPVVSRDRPQRPNTLELVLKQYDLNLQSSDEDEDVPTVNYSPQ